MNHFNTIMLGLLLIPASMFGMDNQLTDEQYRQSAIRTMVDAYCRKINDLYDTLGASRTATPQEIEECYDQQMERVTTRSRFNAFYNAARVLLNPDFRTFYDKKINEFSIFNDSDMRIGEAIIVSVIKGEHKELYGIIGVQRSATQQELEASVERAKAQSTEHPDYDLVNASLILLNPHFRNVYDKWVNPERTSTKRKRYNLRPRS